MSKKLFLIIVGTTLVFAALLLARSSLAQVGTPTPEPTPRPTPTPQPGIIITSVNPVEGLPGTTVTVRGETYSVPTGIVVTIKWNTDVVTSTLTDNFGLFTAVFTVPITATPGIHTIWAEIKVDTTTFYDTATFRVIAPTPTPTPTVTPTPTITPTPLPSPTPTPSPTLRPVTPIPWPTTPAPPLPPATPTPPFATPTFTPPPHFPYPTSTPTFTPTFTPIPGMPSPTRAPSTPTPTHAMPLSLTITPTPIPATLATTGWTSFILIAGGTMLALLVLTIHWLRGKLTIKG